MIMMKRERFVGVVFMWVYRVMCGAEEVAA
jgi:hypothetical protein